MFTVASLVDSRAAGARRMTGANAVPNRPIGAGAESASPTGDARQRSGRRFGDYAIAAGLIEPIQLQLALALQARTSDPPHVHVYIGTILVQQGLLTRPQVVQLLKAQRVQIAIDPATRRQFNIHEFDPRGTYRSPVSNQLLIPVPVVESLMVQGDVAPCGLFDTGNRTSNVTPRVG
jgi:hypothetical protein